MEKLKGIIKKIVFFNDKNNYYILKVNISDSNKEITALGCGQFLKIHDFIELEGEYKTVKYKKETKEQLHCNYIKQIQPTTEETIFEYLSSGIVKGIGKGVAKQMITIWGADSLKILDTNPYLLSRLKGVGHKKLSVIINSWQEVKPQEEFVSQLIEIGFTSYQSISIFKKYGDKSLEVLYNNPYTLNYTLGSKIPFECIDVIARKIGYSLTDPKRIRATIQFFIDKEHESTGHTLIEYNHLMKIIHKYLNIDFEYILNTLNESIDKKFIFYFNREDGFYLQSKSVKNAESEISEKLFQLSNNMEYYKNNPKIYELKIIKRKGEKELKLEQEQVNAVLRSVNSKLSILTGKPGTGKTTVLNEIVKQLKYLGKKNILLCAPTGKAAQKMRESTGIFASTIHRLLEFNPMKDKFERNITNPLDAEVLIIDECSMIDIFLMGNLLRAIHDNTQVIFIGDINQLSSVQCGAVLRDMMQSGVIPFSSLNQIHRTSAESDIIKTAHKITEDGIFDIVSNKDKKSDLYFIDTDSDEKTVCILEKIIKEKIEDFGFNIYNDVQVLTSIHQGLSGTINLNNILQKILNKTYDEDDINKIKAYNFSYKINDKVIQIINNYDKEVFNGDCGIIKEIESEFIIVEFDGKEVFYKHKEINELAPAYCLSIHKSQGSEYPIVIMPFNQKYSNIMDRSLIYTGITRGKKMVILIGNRKVLEKACMNEKSRFRKTNLKENIQRIFNFQNNENKYLIENEDTDFIFLD